MSKFLQMLVGARPLDWVFTPHHGSVREVGKGEELSSHQKLSCGFLSPTPSTSGDGAFTRGSSQSATSCALIRVLHFLDIVKQAARFLLRATAYGTIYGSVRLCQNGTAYSQRYRPHGTKLSVVCPSTHIVTNQLMMRY